MMKFTRNGNQESRLNGEPPESVDIKSLFYDMIPLTQVNSVLNKNTTSPPDQSLRTLRVPMIPAFKGLACVYCLTCTHTGEVIIGETSNLSNRIKAYRYTLRAGTADNVKLQDRFNQYGPHGFVFSVLDAGPWEPEALENGALKRRQDQLLAEYPHQEKLLNIDDTLAFPRRGGSQRPPVSTQSRQRLQKAGTAQRQLRMAGFGQVSVDQRLFSTIEEASKALELSREKLRGRLNSVNYPTWFIRGDWKDPAGPVNVSDVSTTETRFSLSADARKALKAQGKGLVSIHGQVFMTDAEAYSKLGVSRQVLRTRLQSSKDEFRQWFITGSPKDPENRKE